MSGDRGAGPVDQSAGYESARGSHSTDGRDHTGGDRSACAHVGCVGDDVDDDPVGMQKNTANFATVIQRKARCLIRCFSLP